MSHPSKAKGTTFSRDGWTLTESHEFADMTMFGDRNKTFFVGLKDVTATFNGKDLRTHPELDWITDPQVRMAVEIGIAEIRGEIVPDD